MGKYCEICGKEIRYPSIKYCRRCKTKAYKKKRREQYENQKTPCIDCGKLSIRKRCHDCNSKVQGTKIRKKRVTRKCKVCGVPLPNSTYNKRYCDVCYTWRRTQRKHTKICQNCGKACNGKYCKVCSYLIRYGIRVKIRRFVDSEIEIVGKVSGYI